MKNLFSRHSASNAKYIFFTGLDTPKAPNIVPEKTDTNELSDKQVSVVINKIASQLGNLDIEERKTVSDHIYAQMQELDLGMNEFLEELETSLEIVLDGRDIDITLPEQSEEENQAEKVRHEENMKMIEEMCGIYTFSISSMHVDGFYIINKVKSYRAGYMNGENAINAENPTILPFALIPDTVVYDAQENRFVDPVTSATFSVQDLIVNKKGHRPSESTTKFVRIGESYDAHVEKWKKGDKDGNAAASTGVSQEVNTMQDKGLTAHRKMSEQTQYVQNLLDQLDGSHNSVQIPIRFNQIYLRIMGPRNEVGQMDNLVKYLTERGDVPNSEEIKNTWDKYVKGLAAYRAYRSGEAKYGYQSKEAKQLVKEYWKENKGNSGMNKDEFYKNLKEKVAPSLLRTLHVHVNAFNVIQKGKKEQLQRELCASMEENDVSAAKPYIIEHLKNGLVPSPSQEEALAENN